MLLQIFEQFALYLQPYGYHLAFSGGKDSQVIYELARMSGVKFKAFFNKTSVDPPELLKFIRTYYPDVVWIKPEMTMFQLIYKKGMLPLRQKRFCCDYLKENSGNNSVVIQGITNEESDKRKKRQEFEQDYKKKTKYFLNPIKEWTREEVFNFLKFKDIKWCDLYNNGYNRIGCIGCPMNTKGQRKDFKERPKFKLAYINIIEKLRKEKGKYLDFESAEDVLEWWSSGKSKKRFFAEKRQIEIKF